MTTPAGDRVNIDQEMVPVIRRIWRLGLTTSACCQDVGEATAALRDPERPRGYGGDGFIAFHIGYALLKLPRADAHHLIDRLLTTRFRDRVRLRWRAGSWRVNAPFECEDGRSTLATTAVIHFPREQIPELTDTLDGVLSVHSKSGA